MSPFDVTALVAMLHVFYPNATAADIARARRERPEYFGGGRLRGTDGLLLELPDGRLFQIEVP